MSTSKIKYSLFTCTHKWSKKEKDGRINQIPCQKCTACQLLNKLQWQTRIEWTDKLAYNGSQITLTYENEHLPVKTITDYSTGEVFDDVDIQNADMSAFLQVIRVRDRRNRKLIPVPDLPKLTMFGVSERCPTSNRPHYHLIAHNFHPLTRLTDQSVVEEIWGRGNVTAKPVHNALYTIKDFVKQYDPAKETIEGYEKSIRFISNGIGLPYIQLYGEKHRRDNNPYMNTRNGPILMPKYFLRKIWPDLTIDQILKVSPFMRFVLNNIKDNDLPRVQAELQRLGYESVEDYQVKHHKRELFRRKFFHPIGITDRNSQEKNAYRKIPT